jgi:ABC-2 type transport system ATP-binding protein
MTRPGLLLLDEPTSGLDPLMEEVFRHCVQEARETGQTVLLSSHILSEVEALCDRVGHARAINTVAGFASWRVLGILRVLGAIWGCSPPRRLPTLMSAELTSAARGASWRAPGRPAPSASATPEMP